MTINDVITATDDVITATDDVMYIICIDLEGELKYVRSHIVKQNLGRRSESKI